MPYLWERLLGNTDGKGSNGGGASTSLRLHNVCIERGQIKMARCAKCNQEVTTGYVLCDRCYKKMDGIREDSIKEILGDNYDLDHLKEIVQADKEGKCVVLPCKDWLEIVFGEQEVFYGIDMDCIEHPIREISVDSSSRCTWYDGWKSVVIKGYDENGFDWDFEPEEIGETVFFTREEAEAALEKMKRGNE